MVVASSDDQNNKSNKDVCFEIIEYKYIFVFIAILYLV